MKSPWQKVFCPRCRDQGEILAIAPNGRERMSVCPLCLGSGRVERAKKDEWEQAWVAQHPIDKR